MHRLGFVDFYDTVCCGVVGGPGCHLEDVIVCHCDDAAESKYDSCNTEGDFVEGRSLSTAV